MKKKLKKQLICFTLFVLAFLFVQCSKNVNSELQTMAQEANRICPKFLDDATRLDSCAAIPDKTYRCYHTVTTMVRGPLYDSIAFRNQVRPIVISTIKINPAIDFFKKNGVTFQYQYNDSKGNYLCMIVAHPEDYK